MLGHRVFDARSDIYSLGATLYELLTLRPSSTGGTAGALLRQIAQDEPIPPRRLDPSIPRDLETIVQKAMDKEPERRYATVRELAEDLRRFLEDRPIRARRPTPAEGRGEVGAAVSGRCWGRPRPPRSWPWPSPRRCSGGSSGRRGMYDNLLLAPPGQMEQIFRVSDELTIKGMSRFAASGPSPGADPIAPNSSDRPSISTSGRCRHPDLPADEGARLPAAGVLTACWARRTRGAEGDFRRSLRSMRGCWSSRRRIPS